MIFRRFREGAAQNRPAMGATARPRGGLTGFCLRILPGLAFALTLLASQGLAVRQADAANWVVNINDTGSDPALAGGTIVYSITVTNDDIIEAPANTLNLAIPAGMTFTGGSGTITACAPTPATNATVTCDIPILTGGGSATLQASVRPNTTGTLTVTASVPTLGIDIVPENNSASESTTVNAGTDMRLTLSGPATRPSGSSANYTFTAANLGPLSASNVLVSIPVPTGFTALQAPAGCVVSAGTYTCTITGPIGAGSSSNLIFTGQVSAAPGTVIPVSGTITASTPQDSVPGNESASLSTTVTTGTDVAISKTVSPSGAVSLNATVTFTLTASYSGETPAGFRITDTLPANFTILSVTPSAGSGWSCSVTGQLVDCTRGAGPGVGGAVPLGSVTISATASTIGTPSNTANIASTGASPPPEQNTANNASTVSVSIVNEVADLQAIKTGPSVVAEGVPFNFGISARNNGNRAFTGTLVLTDELPAGLSLVDAIPPSAAWTCTPDPNNGTPVAAPVTVVCQAVYTAAAPLAVGATTPVTQLRVTSTAGGAVTNSVTVSSVNPNFPDTTPGNNTATRPVTVTPSASAADIGVIKTRSNASVMVGDTQTITLEVTNAGPGTSSSVNLADNLQNLFTTGTGPGQGLESVTTAPGVATGLACSSTGDGANGRWLNCSMTSLPVCTPGVDCPVVTAVIRVGDKANANTASVSSTAVGDPNSSNNSSSVTWTLTNRADLIMSKSVSPATPTAGQNFTYSLQSYQPDHLNYSHAFGVTITDTLPSNMVFVSATPTGGDGSVLKTCPTLPAAGSVTGPGNNQLVCSMAYVGFGAGGQAFRVAVVMRPLNATIGQVITNTATTASATLDANPANNTATITHTVNPPSLDLQINKTDSVDPVAVSSATTYSLTVTNNGPSAAENVTITDTLPATGLAYASHTLPAGSGGSCATVPAAGQVGGTLECNFPTLTSGQSRVVTVTMTGVDPGVFTNTVSVASDETRNGWEPNLTNNTATQTTTVQRRVDLELISKVPSVPDVTLGTPFDYVITLRNRAGAGLVFAEEVRLTDTLPAGMMTTGPPVAVVTSGTASQNSCSAAADQLSFSCDFGTVSAGGEITVTAPVAVVEVPSAPLTLTNTAAVSTTTIDINSANNTASGDVTVSAGSFSGTVFVDFNDNFVMDAVDTPLANVTMTMTRTSAGAPFSITTTTDANGNYTFATPLPPGTFRITRGAVPTPPGSPSRSRAGTVGGASNGTSQGGGTEIGSITLGSNREGTGYLFTVAAGIQPTMSKSSADYVINTDGSITTNFIVGIGNTSSLEPMEVTATDQLAGAQPYFGSYVAGLPTVPGSYTVTSGPTGNCPGVNASYNGASSPVLFSGGTLAVGAECEVEFRIRFMPVSPPPIAYGDYINYADGEVRGVLSGKTLTLQVEASINLASNPAIGLVKPVGTYNDVNGNGPDPGDTISYVFSVSNLGNAGFASFTVSDPKIATITCAATTLESGGVTTCTGDYVLTAADVIAGKVENQATATGTPAYGAPVSDLSDPVTPGSANNAPTITPLPSVSRLGLTKTVDKPGPVPVGEVLTYTVTATNTGNTTQTDVAVTDSLITPSSQTCATLAPGATCVLTGSYTVTTANADAGQVDNTASTQSTEVTTPVTASLTVPVTQTRSLSLTKLVDKPGPVPVGEVLTYTVTATNTGNTTQTSVSVTDNLITPSSQTCATLAPGATCVLTGSYTVTTANADAGQVDNTASTESTEVTTPVTASLTVPVIQTRSLSLTKVVDKPGPVPVGEVLTYTVTATNTGNTTQTSVAVTDNLITPSSQTCATLAPGATCVLTGSYTVTTANADAGQVDNTASTQSTEVTTPVTASLTVPVTQTRSLSLTKVVDKPGPVPVGEVLTYTVTATNTGNTTQTDVAVTDSLITPSSQTCATLAPGATCVLTGSYTVTTANADAGQVDNTASTQSTEVTTPVTASLTVPVIQTRSLSLTKSVDTAGPVSLGDELVYTLTATNSGTTTLTNVTISDPLLWTGAKLCGSGVLSPGASCVLTGSYVVQQADVDAGRVLNTAVAGSSETPDTAPATTDTPAISAAELSITKTVDADGPVRVGEKLTYRVTATNSGPSTQTNVIVEDGLIRPGSVTCATLAPGERCVLTGSYVVTVDDAVAGKVDNTATARSDAVQKPVSASTSTPVEAKGDINSIAKTALVTTVRRGEKVPYEIVAQNVAMSPARIIDIMPSGFNYVKGSATVNGKPVEPSVDARNLIFDGLKPNRKGVITLKLTLIVTSGVKPGDAVNRAELVNPANGNTVSEARARVTIMEEAVFDCSGVIGKVFDDKNHNGYQDEGEPGLPAVRIATVRGLLVTTDANGRFHVACADMPDTRIGENFVMKLDTRTLPAGYHVTSENPRRVRLTAGKVVKLNFGAAMTRTVRLDLNEKVFEAGKTSLKPKWQAGLGQLIVALAAEPSVLQVTYVGKGDALAKERIRAVTRDIKKRWQSQGPPYRLDIDTRLVAAGGEGGE